jgi:hypothetical protein
MAQNGSKWFKKMKNIQEIKIEINSKWMQMAKGGNGNSLNMCTMCTMLGQSHEWRLNLAPDCQKMQKACVQSSRKSEGNEHQQANEKLWNVMTVSDLAVKVTANVP